MDLQSVQKIVPLRFSEVELLLHLSEASNDADATLLRLAFQVGESSASASASATLILMRKFEKTHSCN